MRATVLAALRPVLAAAALLLGVATAFADAAQDCDQDKDHDLTVKGCTEFIAAGQGGPQALAIAHYQRGGAHLQKLDTERAMADFNEAIRLDPKHANAFFRRAFLFKRKHDYDSAVSDYDAILAIVAERLAAGPSENLSKFAQQTRALRESAKRDGDLEMRWIKYLEGIQAQNDYPNWASPPLDRHLQNRGKQ